MSAGPLPVAQPPTTDSKKNRVHDLPPSSSQYAKRQKQNNEPSEFEKDLSQITEEINNHRM